MTAHDYVARAAELLTEHSPMTSVDALHNCSCGWAPDDHWPTLAEFAAHQAEVLAAAGLLPTSTEWGARVAGLVCEFGPSEAGAAAYAVRGNRPLVSRAVTDWKDAPDD